MHASSPIGRVGRAAGQAAIAAALALGLLTAPGLAGAQTTTPTKTQTTTVRLRSGTMTVSLFARTYATLTEPTTGSDPDTRSLSPIGPAAATRASGGFRFPLSGGLVDLTGVAGSATSRGGIEFSSVSQNPTIGQSSAVQFQLTGFALRLSSSPAELTATFTGMETYRNLPVMSLVTTGAHASHRGATVTISGIGLELLAAGAQLFNQQAYNDELRRFRVGQRVGTATLTGIR